MAVLWQAGLRNTTCTFGTHLTPLQLRRFPTRRIATFTSSSTRMKPKRANALLRALARRLQRAGLVVSIVQLPVEQRLPTVISSPGRGVADFTSAFKEQKHYEFFRDPIDLPAPASLLFPVPLARQDGRRTCLGQHISRCPGIRQTLPAFAPPLSYHLLETFAGWFNRDRPVAEMTSPRSSIMSAINSISNRSRRRRR